MRVDDLSSFRPDVVKVLESGVRVVSYNGMQDVRQRREHRVIGSSHGILVAHLQQHWRVVALQRYGLEWQGTPLSLGLVRSRSTSTSTLTQSITGRLPSSALQRRLGIRTTKWPALSRPLARSRT